MKDRLVILGSGTCNLVADKAGASVLIENSGTRLVYDFGRGVAIRLTELRLRQDDVQHVFLSHFHPDHVSDLIPYVQAASRSRIDKRTKDLNIYGPKGTTAFVESMFSVYGWGLDRPGFDIRVHDVSDNLQIDRVAFDVVDLQHSHGLRFGDYALAADADEVNADLVRLLKDAAFGVFDAGHITDEEIVDLATRTQARTLVCSHQYRKLDEDALNSAAQAKGYTGRLVVAKDLMPIA